MYVVRIIGGLGNQMFQFAFYSFLARRLTDVKIDTLGFENYDLHTGFELERVFGITANKVSLSEVNRITDFYNETILLKLKRKISGRRRNYMNESSFSWSVIESKQDLYLDGYWQNDSFFDHKEVLDIFQFKKDLSPEYKKIVNSIKTCNSVSIHVRRGDYVGNKVYALCDVEYYREAISYIQGVRGNLVFYVFTNDKDWVSKTLLPSLSQDLKLVMVETNYLDPSVDMRLMSICKNNIIANSSFSWWGAWLNQNREKIVIAPRMWYNDKRLNFDYINDLPKSWKLI